ncbi:Serine phosphatase RsbU, regulator of sigma subunit / Serine-protein kinase RsbW [hydrothermal vent metagenome]|uniref:Serine phosphatase RsbU, regulator of sigma subunit / Serine-protein kinase RsbW n=1 Tax=hydrothermal vent metagenome TaxID=652676 RepID=A0A3B1C255_9ZZZZ
MTSANAHLLNLSGTESAGLALIADDELSNRFILKALLKKMGYAVVQAEDGVQAVERFTETHPDIIFMDIMMPVMDGFEATARIKKLCGNAFIPIIFLTAMTDEKALARCIEVGGDDFLTKPFNHTLLKSKIRAIERIRDLHREVSKLLGMQQREEEIAEKIFSGAVISDNVIPEKFASLMRPAAVFSGDVLLTAHAPNGDLNVLLGDFTGHGLSAALGALPVSETFRAMTGKGFSVDQILNEINRKLHTLLPTGMFMAAQFARVNHTMDVMTICCCGMPDILITSHDGTEIKCRIPSTSLPLGILPDADYLSAIANISCDLGDRVLMASDGVTEARSPTGEYFGQQRLETALFQKCHDQNHIACIRNALDEFCRDAPQDDDISLIEVPFLPDVLATFESEQQASTKSVDLEFVADTQINTLEFAITLNGPRLLRIDPVPLLINQIQELEDLKEQRRIIFTILSELYINALDHGVLKLDSALKAQHDGFSKYFEERENRLQNLTSGAIKIVIQSRLYSIGGEISIRVEDSGPGFDYKSYKPAAQKNGLIPSGRGMMLIKELCKSVAYSDPGNKVEAVYTWSDD